MAVLAQLSDPHIRLEPYDPVGVAGLERAVAHVLRLDQAPDAVLVSGDLTDNGTAEEYARVAELLAPLPMPVHVLCGNHDLRGPLRERFGVPGGALDPIRSVADITPELRLVCCDTTVPGIADGSGSMDAEQLAWLDAVLAEAPGTATIVAMHHPPIAIGIPVLDRIGLPPADVAALAEVLARHGQVRRVVAGHVHRTALGTCGGVGVFTCASTERQAVLDLEAEAFRIVEEPVTFAVHALVDGALVTHVQPVMDR